METHLCDTEHVVSASYRTYYIPAFTPPAEECNEAREDFYDGYLC